MDPNVQIIRTPYAQGVATCDAIQATIDTLNTNLTQAEADRDAAQNANSQLLTQVSTLEQQVTALNAQIAAAASVLVFDNQEQSPWSVTVGQGANSAGNTAVASTDQSVPTDKCAFLKLMTPANTYADGYFYKNRALTLPNAKAYKYEGRIMLPTAVDCAASQALELDIEQRLSHVCRNAGFQWDFAEKLLRVWNRGPAIGNFPHGWVSTGVSLARWSPLVWHAFELNAHTDGQTVFYDNIKLDGVAQDLSAFSFPVIQLAEGDCMNNAIQLDGNSAGATYQACIDAIKLTVG